MGEQCTRTIFKLALTALFCLVLTSCHATSVGEPSIEFTRIPTAGEGDPDKLEAVEGRVLNFRRGQQIVLFARSGMWWVQPFANQPFTAIQADSRWKNLTHPGIAYAALLVDSRFHPLPTIAALPTKGGPVFAVATVEGAKPSSPPKMLTFSGYQWEIRNSASDRAGSPNFFDQSNAWTDPEGLLICAFRRPGSSGGAPK